MSAGGSLLVRPGGRRLAYREYGSGRARPWFYCHGMPGCSAQLPEALRSPGAPWRVIAVQRPGYGQSDAAPEQVSKRLPRTGLHL